MLTFAQENILIALAKMQPGTLTRVKVGTIASAAGCSEKTVRTAIRRLSELKLIEAKKASAGGSSSVYAFALSQRAHLIANTLGLARKENSKDS